jgi:hypothetical protein
VVIDVEAPHEVLGDLKNIPEAALDQIISEIRDVLDGSRKFASFGWHRVSCDAFIDHTDVVDLHAEDMRTTPWFTVPTEEILKLLEDYHAFYKVWYADYLSRKGLSGHP